MTSKPKTNVRTARGPLSPDEITLLTNGRVSGAALARIAGISRQRACKLLAQGHDALEIATARRGGSVASPKRGAAGAAAGSDAGGETLAELQRRRLRQRIERERLDLEERQGQLIPAEKLDAAVAYFRYLAGLLMRLLFALPATLADDLEGRKAAEIRQLLDKAFCGMLDLFHAEERRAFGEMGIEADDQEQER